MTPLLGRWACPALPAGLVLPGARGTAAFLPRAGKHVARPVWPLPAVPLSRQPGIGELLVKPALSAGHPRSFAQPGPPAGAVQGHPQGRRRERLGGPGAVKPTRPS